MKIALKLKSPDYTKHHPDGPAFSKDIITKVQEPKEFDQSASLISMMTGQDYTSSYNVQP